MPSDIRVGDAVFVPGTAVGDTSGPALVSRSVLAREERSVIVDSRDGQSVRVATSKVHRNVGVLVLTIGDLKTEDVLLGPLRRSVVQYFRLLLPDNQVHQIQIRTESELDEVWRTEHGAISHVVLVGHGMPNAVCFVDPQQIDGPSLGAKLSIAGALPKEIISLACQTGRAAFARPFSESPVCASFLAPYQSIHGATASQFCQMYFTARFLGGASVKVAFRAASKGLGVGGHFRLWQSGKFTTIN